MGLTQSSSASSSDRSSGVSDTVASAPRPSSPAPVMVLEQEPELLPCRAADSPLSPQPSAAATPRLLLPSNIRVYDPSNILAPPHSRPAPTLYAHFAGDTTEVYLVTHGECLSMLRQELVSGRLSQGNPLTARGERQARALAVSLRSRGVRFSGVHCSPLDRARSTAALVCRELNFPMEQTQFSDDLVEISHGLWEGCSKTEIFTAEMINLMDHTQPDFSAPSGESLRQVQFRMIEFLNKLVLRLPERLTMEDALLHHNEVKDFSRQSSSNSIGDGTLWDAHFRMNRANIQRKKSGKSRLQFVTTVENGNEEDISPNESAKMDLLDANLGYKTASIGIFSHATPIKCVLSGLLDCSPNMIQRICIDDSSVTVLEHSLRTGWQIKKMNDTSHLTLL